MMIACVKLFFTFLKLGFISFGGGYAMLSMIMTESRGYGITTGQLADLNTLDMVVPGSIAINAATYVGYLSQGIPGAIAATAGVSVPSFILTVIIMRFFAKFQNNLLLKDVLSGVKPATVGLVAAAAALIAPDLLTIPGKSFSGILNDPLGTLSWLCLGIFLLTAVLSIRFKVNPLLLTVLAGAAGAVLLR